MKQLIVLVATVILGIAIAGLVLGFQDNAETISENAETRLESVFATTP